MKKLSSKYLAFLVILLIIQSIFALHFMSSEQYMNQRYKQLYDKQKNFENKVDTILVNISALQKKIAHTQNNTEKAQLLENALLQQRKQIYNLSNSLLPSSQMAKYRCDKLTDQEKTQLTSQIQKTKNDIKDFKKIAQQIKPCAKLTEIQVDIAKQQDFLARLQDILHSQCKDQSLLVQGALQSNVYAKNWVLGQQTIDQLIDQYAQRSLLFDNVTNCPLQFPFYNGKQCIQCPSSRPVFNMYSKVCQNCKYDTQVDNDLRRCIQKQHYSNFKDGSNYNLDGQLTLPQNNDSTKSPCPKQTPFFNGTKCVVCYYPRYWSVSKLSCNQCASGLVFDINIHSCVVISDKKLSVLENTNWVTDDGNIQKVYDDRAKVLQLNKTTKDYTYCNAMTPFFDTVSCVICDHQFNINQKKCTSAPQGYIFNLNTRTYTKLQPNKQTNTKGQKYITQQTILDNPNIQNCPIERPFYDGYSCIQCSKPFDIFDSDAKQCVQCSKQTLYNSADHACKMRSKIYLSTQNLEGLMSTNNTSYQKYQQQIKDKIANNPNAYFIDCKEDQYSDFNHCFTCQNGQYFNIQTKKCDVCDGSLDSQTYKCKQNIYLFTNLNATKITNLNQTKEEEQQKIKTFLQTHPASKICPIQTPYSNNKSCIACSNDKITNQPKLFNYQSGKCQLCPTGNTYVLKDDKCQPFIYLSNLNANGYVIPEGQTMESLQSKQQETKKTKLTKACPIQTPYAIQGTSCISCTDLDPYFDPVQVTCTSCRINEYYSALARKCTVTPYVNNPAANNFLQYGNSTYQKFFAQQQNVIKTGKYGICPQSAPYTTGTSCIACGQDQPHFNISNKQCVSCSQSQTFINEIRKCVTIHFLTDLTNKDLIEEGNYTVANLKVQQQQLKKNQVTSKCIKDHPFASKQQCISCDQQKKQYFNLKTQQCQGCQQHQKYIPELRKCVSLIFLTDLSASNLIQQNQATIENLQTQQQKIKSLQPNAYKKCQGDTPYALDKSCIGCPDKNAPYFNLDIKQCQGCATGETYVSEKRICMVLYLLTNENLTATNYILNPQKNATLEQLAKDNKEISSKFPVKYCTQKTPYSNGQQCLSCQGSYYDFQLNVCTSCSQFQYFHPQDHLCKKRTIITNTDKALNYIETQNVTMKNYIDNNSALDPQKVYICPQQKPFSQENGCVGCPHQQNKYYNLEKKVCQNCGDGYYYEQSDFMCEKIVPRYPNLGNANWIVNDNNQEKIYTMTKQLKAVPGAVQCPKGRQFYNKNTNRCVSCNLDEFYNYDAFQCQKCPSGAQFTANLHECIIKVAPGTYQTSLQSDNLVYGGKSQAQYMDEYNQNKENHPNIKDCPKQKPYLDKVGCVYCPSVVPYFNLRYKMCMNCPTNYQYNENSRQCLNVQGQAISSPPNPPKMLAQIF